MSALEFGDVTYKIPSVTGPGNPTFDQQIVKFVDNDGRMTHEARIIRDRHTRPHWNVEIDGFSRTQHKTIAERVSLADANAAVVDYFTSVMQQG